MTNSTYQQVKETGKHGVIYGLTNALVLASGFILLPIYTRFLTPSEYGIWILILITTNVFKPFFFLGLEVALLRFFFQKNNKKFQEKIISNVLIIIFFSSSLLFIVGFFSSNFISNILFNSNKYIIHFQIIFFVGSLDLFSQIFFVILRLKRKSIIYSLVRISNFFIKVGIITILIVFSHWNIMGIIFGQFFSYLITFIILFIYLFKYIKIQYSKRLSKKILSFGIPLIFNSLALLLLNLSDRFIINFYLTLNEVGIYNVGYQIASVIIVFVIHPFKLIFGPIQFEIMKDNNAKKYYQIMFLYLFIMLVFSFLIITLLSKDGLKLLIGRDYWAAINIIPIICFGYIFFGMRPVINLGLLFKNQTIYIAVIAGFCTTINIILNLILIPFFKLNGAAISTTITFVILLLLYYYYNQKIYAVKYDWKRITYIIGLGSVLFIFGWFVPFEYLWSILHLNNIFFNIVFRIFIVLLYPLVIWKSKFLSKNEKESVINIICSIKRKIVTTHV